MMGAQKIIVLNELCPNPLLRAEGRKSSGTVSA